ncbi:MAG: hypothetical protein LUF04_09820 [Bacteroides sp.]|nr:hypothetical protein [Bacteroides sp.]
MEAFLNLLEVYDEEAERWESIEELVTLRVGHLFERVLDRLNLSFEEALQRLKNQRDFNSVRERNERDILVAAIDNLVDFASTQQYAMLRELPDRLDEEDIELYETISRKYNQVNAVRENLKVLYAAMMAGWWWSVPDEGMISFRTRGDKRVRLWHQSLEGMSFPKGSFPPEYIPPIEWGCRCCLIAEGNPVGNYDWNSMRALPDIDPVFKESLATGGRIFSADHIYFKENLPMEMKKMSKRIKQKLYNP